jgi:Second Messenger Oligonucleotide or Dinucleotide Synthetase domain
VLTIDEAFRKFKSRLELSPKEQADASRRQMEIRSHMDEKFAIDTDFLTGSYRRWTKTKPLKDVDIFCVLGEKERHYREKPPAVLLGAVAAALAEKYGSSCVCTQRRSVNVDFGVPVNEDQTDELVMSFDVVPAFAKEDYFEIPDTGAGAGWTKTNPKIHEQLAVDAHAGYSGEWKALVRMMKYWNRHRDKPIRPSFLIEVMALEVLHPPFGGQFDREMQGFFHGLADRIDEVWEDPAGLGPAVSDSMDAARCAFSRQALLEAGAAATQAIRLTREGKNGAALQAWRDLLGPLFPLS